MKQIDYRTAVELMAFSGCTEIRIMVTEADPIDYNTLYLLNQAGQVLFFVPDDFQMPDSPPPARNRRKRNGSTGGRCGRSTRQGGAM